MMHLRGLRRMLASRRSIFSVILVGLAAWLVGACTIVASGMSATADRADVILVLGNSVDHANHPFPRLEARLEAALALYRRGSYGTVMVSGGIDPVDGRNEALGMRDWLVARGVPAERIVTDYLGNNTRESAEHAQAWLSLHDLHGAVIVSQYFHLPRARLSLRQAGIRDCGGFYPSRWFARDIYSTLREVPAYLAYWTRRR